MSSVHDGSEGKDTQLPLSTISSSPHIRTSAFPPSSFSSSPPSLSSTSMNTPPQPTRSRTGGVRHRSRSTSLSVQLELDPLITSSSSRIPTVSRRMSHGLQRVNSSVIPEDSPILTSSPPSISSGINVKKPTYPSRGGSYFRSRHTPDNDYVSEGSDVEEQDDTNDYHDDPNEYEYDDQPMTNEHHSSTRIRSGSIEQSRHRASYRSRSSSISTFPFPSSKPSSSSSSSSKSSLTRKISLGFLIILALFLIGTIIVLSTVRHYFGIPESADLTERDVLWDHGKGNIREFQQEKYGLHDHFNVDSIEDGVAIEDLGHGNGNGNGIWGKEGKGSGGYWMKRNWNGVVGETTSWQRLYNVTNL